MKKYLFTIVLIIVAVLVSGCTTDQTQSTNQTKTYDDNGISFTYPENWAIIQSKAENSTVAVGDPKTADSASGNVKTSVIVQKIAKPSDSSLKDFYNATYAQYAAQNPSYTRVSDGTLTINGAAAYENIYKVIVNEIPKQERAVWVENKRVVYVILCSAPTENFDKEQNNFNMVIDSFKFQ